MRGSQLSDPLSWVTLARTLGVGIIALAVAWQNGNWVAVLAAEAFGFLIVAAAALFWVDRHIERAASAPAADTALASTGRQDQFQLFLAFLIVALPKSLDRAWVTAVAQPWNRRAMHIARNLDRWGLYVRRHLYPKGRTGHDPSEAVARRAVATAAAGTFILVAACNAALAVVGFLACYFLTNESVFLKYGLNGSAITITIIAAVLQFTPVLDWALIARDRERELLVASGVFVAVWAIGMR